MLALIARRRGRTLRGTVVGSMLVRPVLRRTVADVCAFTRRKNGVFTAPHYHDITLEDAPQRKRREMRETIESICSFFKCFYATAALIKTHSPNGRAAADYGAGKGTAKCVSFSIIHVSRLRFCIRRIYAELLAACLIQCSWSYRDRQFNHATRNCDFVLRALSNRFAWIDAFIFQYLNIPTTRIILEYVYTWKCKINCYLIYMTIFRLYIPIVAVNLLSKYARALSIVYIFSDW